MVVANNSGSETSASEHLILRRVKGFSAGFTSLVRAFGLKYLRRLTLDQNCAYARVDSCSGQEERKRHQFGDRKNSDNQAKVVADRSPILSEIKCFRWS